MPYKDPANKSEWHRLRMESDPAYAAKVREWSDYHRKKKNESLDAADPERVVRREHRNRMKLDAEYAQQFKDSRKAEAKAKKIPKPRKQSAYPPGWGHEGRKKSAVEKIANQANNHYARQTQGEWERKATDLCRGISINAKWRRLKPREKVEFDWSMAVATCIQAIKRDVYSNSSSSLYDQWRYKSHRLAKSIKSRVLNEADQA